MGKHDMSQLRTETGCTASVWYQHPEIGERPVGVYLRLAMDENLPNGVRSAELRLTEIEAMELAKNLLEATKGSME
jgi:hypothetical protein